MDFRHLLECRRQFVAQNKLALPEEMDFLKDLTLTSTMALAMETDSDGLWMADLDSSVAGVRVCFLKG